MYKILNISLILLLSISSSYAKTCSVKLNTFDHPITNSTDENDFNEQLRMVKSYPLILIEDQNKDADFIIKSENIETQKSTIFNRKKPKNVITSNWIAVDKSNQGFRVQNDKCSASYNFECQIYFNEKAFNKILQLIVDDCSKM